MPQPDRQAPLIRASSDLDSLIADVGLGPRSQADIDEWESRCQRIADDLRAAFRAPVASTIRPLKLTPNGAWY